MSDYDPQKDAMGSYYAAVEAKRLRGDRHWPERQPTDPDEPLAWYHAPFSYRLIASLVAIEAAAILAFLWFVGAV